MSKIEEYWASFFGLGVSDFLKPQPKVVPHARLEEWQGAWLFRCGTSLIISVPRDMVKQVETAVGRKPHASITDAKFVALLGDKVGKVIGPAYQGCLERTNFRPVTSSARLLSSQDKNSLHTLAASCDAVEWEHGDIEVGNEPIFGCFINSCLVAASSYRMETDTAASPGIITHPAYRGRGFGKAVLSAATEHGLDNGFLMLYQTLVRNVPAVVAAESLGYQKFATSLAIRFR